MPDAHNSKNSYALLDRPEVLQFLFHPRKEYGMPADETPYDDVLIPVDDNVVIGARFHMVSPNGVNILFFHGNGEIVSDYNELGTIYNQMGLNFMAVDYRGYGRSTGQPTVSGMMKDCHTINAFVRSWLHEKHFSGALVAMGRSLGSAPALELAATDAARLDGLIVESGFAYAGPLLNLLGIDTDALGFKESQGFGNIDKIAGFKKPLLIIHAERDHIIPFADGQALYDAARSDAKTLLQIPAANHNDIFMRGLKPYLEAIKTLADKVASS